MNIEFLILTGNGKGERTDSESRNLGSPIVFAHS